LIGACSKGISCLYGRSLIKGEGYGAVVPKLLQKQHPPLYTCGKSDIPAIKWPGSSGWDLRAALLPWGVLEKALGDYTNAVPHNGPKVRNIVFLKSVRLCWGR